MVSAKRERRRRVAAWWRDNQLYFLGALVVAAFLLGVVGFWQWYGLHDVQEATLSDAAYKSLQLFTIESGSADAPVPFTLDLARFMAVVAALYGVVAAAVALFGEQISRIGLRMAKGHAIVCGLGDRGLHIAERLLDEGMRVAVIDSDEHAPLLDRAREAGAVTVIGDASDPAILRKTRADRAQYVIAVCPEDGDNAEIAVRLAALVKENPPETPVTAIVHIYDTELCDLLREDRSLADEHQGMRLVFFNVPESGARAMLEAVPPVALDDRGVPHVVVVGLGKFGRSLVLQIARAWWTPATTEGQLPRITVIDRAAEAKAELLCIRYPGLERVGELDPWEMEKNAPEFERGTYLHAKGEDGSRGEIEVDAVYVCPDDDVHALADGLTVLHHTRGHGVPIAVRMTSRAGLATLLAGEKSSGFSDLQAVGVLDATCDIDVLLGGKRESIARAIHERYVRNERATGRTVADNPSMAPWDELPEGLRESSRCQADDIEAKLSEVGMRMVPLTERSPDPPAFTADEVERLSRREHDRWLAERGARGWTFGPTKDAAERTSPYMVPWEDLDEDVRDKDREAVRGIPTFLARAGFTMVRVETGAGVG